METVVEIKKIQGCALLRLDNGETLKVPTSLLRERPVKKGEVMDVALYRQYMAQRGYSHALDSAVKLLALCDRTEGEIREKLTQSQVLDGLAIEMHDAEANSPQTVSQWLDRLCLTKSA